MCLKGLFTDFIQFQCDPTSLSEKPRRYWFVKEFRDNPRVLVYIY